MPGECRAGGNPCIQAEKKYAKTKTEAAGMNAYQADITNE
jgi:hypothetical protein